MIPLTSKKRKLHSKQKVCYICKRGFNTYYDNGIAFNKKY